MLFKNPLTYADNTSILEQINRENNLTEIEVQRGLTSYFPVGVSLGLTLFGVFGFLATFVTDHRVIYLILAFLGLLILFIEHNRTYNIADFLGSKLESRIDKDVKIPFLGLFVALSITVLFIAMDLFGSMTLSDYIERMMIEGIVKNSESYQIEKQKADSGVNEKIQYQKDLALWRLDRDTYYKDCDSKWSIPAYKTKNTQCRKEFTQKEPMLDKNIVGVVDINVYNKLKNEATKEVSGYRDYFFWVFLALSISLNYFALVNLFNQYRFKSKELTHDMIDELRNRFEEIKTEKLNKIRMSTDAMLMKLEEKNIIDVDIEEQQYDILLARRQVMRDGRARIANNIVNGVNLMEHRRAGFIGLPNTMTDNELIDKLFDNGKIQKYGKLILKADIVDPSARGADKHFRAVCHKLRLLGLIEYRSGSGYYALDDYENVKEIYNAQK